MSLYATRDTIRELTSYQRPSAQIRALVAMRIPYRVAPDGYPRVLLSDLPPAGSTHRRQEGGPNYGALTKATS